MSLNPQQLDEIISFVKTVTARTDKLLLAALHGEKRIDHKGEVDLVTEYDQLCEDLIRRSLTDEFPQFAVLAEEGGESGAGSTRWIIDPIDGTTNFSHGHPMFASSIALEERGKCVVGVISMPGLGITGWGRTGSGCYFNGTKTLVSKCGAIDDSLIATGFAYDRRTADDDNTREYRSLMKRSQGIRRCGAACVDMAMVARGVYEGFWEQQLKPWDLAAGKVLIQEAGGRCSDYSGEDLDIYKGWVVATNSLIHDQVLAGIQQARTGLGSPIQP